MKKSKLYHANGEVARTKDGFPVMVNVHPLKQRLFNTSETSNFLIRALNKQGLFVKRQLLVKLATRNFKFS